MMFLVVTTMPVSFEDVDRNAPCAVYAHLYHGEQNPTTLAGHNSSNHALTTNHNSLDRVWCGVHWGYLATD